MSGAAGIWGPSCLAAARLAEHELNQGRGVGGRPCELVLIDAADESADLERRLHDVIEEGEVDALVSMSLSSVRRRMLGVARGRLPFVYTCLHEGIDAAPNLYAIGETAERQLRPSIEWLARRRRPRRWMLVGNDYVWPRVSHAIAARCIAATGAEVVGEQLLPFGTADYSAVLDRLRRLRADAVLISMVGQDAVDFNRAFGRAGLARSVLRLSCAIEENQLLATGAENTEDLHVALGYFGALQTDANLDFSERYRRRFGERAPTLNSIGQSTYEGLHFLAALLGADGAMPAETARDGLPAAYPSARGARHLGAGRVSTPIYLAIADGHLFQVVEQF